MPIRGRSAPPSPPGACCSEAARRAARRRQAIARARAGAALTASIIAVLIAAAAAGGAHAQQARGQLISAASKLCVDVPGGLVQEGLPVRLAPCKDTPGQTVDYDRRTRLMRIGGLCLSVFAGPAPRPLQAHDRVGLLGCSGAAVQRWAPVRCGRDGTCQPYAGPEPLNLMVGDLCLIAPRLGTPGLDIVLDPCSDVKGELFQLVIK
jgi:hypothetical protein